MENFAKLYHFNNLFIIRVIRYSLIVFICLFILNGYFSNEIFSLNFRISLYFLSLYIIFETYFHFKVTTRVPFTSLLKNSGANKLESFTLFAIDSFLQSNKTSAIIKKLLKKKEIKFILHKSDIDPKEVPLLEISKEELINCAFEIALEVSGEAVTTMDLFCSYILTIEPQTKLLFSKKLKKDEFLHILYWARDDFPNEENPKPTRVNFWGEGIGEGWVNGWTLETQKYTIDITPKVLSEKPLLVGREKEFRQTVEGLSKPEKNNVILVGEGGSGKTTLVESLAFESFVGDLQGKLYHKRFLELLLSPLLAGVQNQGDLETRLQNIIAEISHSGNIILFVPEIQNIFGSSTFHIDLSGALFPYLKNKSISIIGTVTTGNYKTYIEQKQNILDFFEVVKLDAPDKQTEIQMLLEKADLIEKKNNVYLTYRAIIKACEFAGRYIQGKTMPGSGVVLLTDAANSVAISGKKVVEEEDIISQIEQKTQIAVGVPVGEEKELLLHLEEKLHERIIDQNEAVFAISEAMRRLRTGLTSATKPISFLFLGPTGVGKTETAKALSSLYFKGEDKMIRLDMSEYQTQDSIKRLLGASPGEGDERGELTDKILEHPFSLVLLDEFEKGNPAILDLFLQVFEDGRLTDNKGRTASFANSIIIATSNAASEFIREEISKGHEVSQQKLLEFLQSNGIFKPELLNRFDAVVVFKPLGENEVGLVVKLLLNSVSKKLLEQDITVSFDEKIVEKISREGFDAQFGARPLRRFIQNNIEDLFAQKLLKDEIKRGDNIVLSTDNTGNIIIR
ncbi:MAG: ATP-dependent Clp protease ATP-binding subunit [bacterium]|nr:ATP-dependent Clp protease ATP-binding subunit [bacterium]